MSPASDVGHGTYEVAPDEVLGLYARRDHERHRLSAARGDARDAAESGV